MKRIYGIFKKYYGAKLGINALSGAKRYDLQPRSTYSDNDSCTIYAIAQGNNHHAMDIEDRGAYGAGVLDVNDEYKVLQPCESIVNQISSSTTVRVEATNEAGITVNGEPI